MDNKPYSLTEQEIREIAKMEDVREMWGANEQEMVENLQSVVYAVKFNFISGSRGYAGDYFILAGDALGEPVQLVRRDSGLEVLV